jgi:hypothetical protein
LEQIYRELQLEPEERITKHIPEETGENLS